MANPTKRTEFKPQTMEQHRGRYAAAVDHVLDDMTLDRPPMRTTGQLPEQVFDFEDGLRLIISKDRWPDGCVDIHFSASVEPDSALWKQLTAMNGMKKKHRQRATRKFFDLVVTRFRIISGSRDPIMLIGFSEGKGVPHWRVFSNAGAPTVPNPSIN